jgi:CRP-like cAMP-binding protein
MAEVPSELGKIELFEEFNQKDFETLMEDATVLTPDAEEPIFAQGDPADDVFYVVLFGEIGIQKDMRNEKEIVSRLSKGDFFGELGLFSDRDRQDGAVPTESSEVLRIPRRSLGKLKGQHPEALVGFYEEMFEKLSGRFKALAEKAEKTQFWF